ncbi:MAG: recombinase family protein [Pseudomonadota bacterium]
MIKPQTCPPIEVPKIIDFRVRRLYQDKAFLYQKYVVEGRSAKEISRMIASSHSTVLQSLKAFGIPKHPAGRKNQSQIAYGEIWENHSVSRNVRETAVVAKMLSLRFEGLSYWKIADHLNANNVPTKTSKGKWSSKTVHQILKRVQQNSSSKIKVRHGGAKSIKVL